MKKESLKKQSDAICPCSAPCPLAKALSAIGGKWKIRIICTLYVDGTQRYNDILKKIAGITAEDKKERFIWRNGNRP